MKRMLQFTKIDIIKAQITCAWMLLFPALSLLLLLREKETPTAFAYLYTMFGGLILSSTPFTMHSQTNNGFLKMLPCKDGEEIKGHFLFSLLVLLVSALLSLITIWIAHLIKPSVAPASYSVYLFLFGVTMVLSALENLLFSLFPSNSAQVQNILRMLPGFIFFFGSLFIVGRLPELVQTFLLWLTITRGCILLLICLTIFLIIMQVCVEVTKRRDAV